LLEEKIKKLIEIMNSIRNENEKLKQEIEILKKEKEITIQKIQKILSQIEEEVHS
jgi:hypothetical protein